MGLPASEQRLLDAIENGLQEDPDLMHVFTSFTSVTRGLGTPATEQLNKRFITAGLGRWRAAGVNRTSALWLIGIAAIGLLLVLGVVTGPSWLGNSRCAALVAPRTVAAFLGRTGALCRGCLESDQAAVRPPRQAISCQRKVGGSTPPLTTASPGIR